MLCFFLMMLQVEGLIYLFMIELVSDLFLKQKPLYSLRKYGGVLFVYLELTS